MCNRSGILRTHSHPSLPLSLSPSLSLSLPPSPTKQSQINKLTVSPPVFVFFLHLHPAVLKPDFHLSLGQTQESCYLVSTIPGEVHVKQKLLFQFEDLVLCIGATLFSGGLRVKPVGRWVIWKQEGQNQETGELQKKARVYCRLEDMLLLLLLLLLAGACICEINYFWCISTLR